MKKIVAAGLAAALVVLPVSGAFASEIKPLTATKSTQAPPSLVALGGGVGGLGGAGLLVGALTVLTVVAIVADSNSSGTTN